MNTIAALLTQLVALFTRGLKEAPTMPLGGTFTIRDGETHWIKDDRNVRKQLVIKNASATNLKLVLPSFDANATAGGENSAFFKTLTAGEEFTAFFGGKFGVHNQSGATVTYRILQAVYV